MRRSGAQRVLESPAVSNPACAAMQQEEWATDASAPYEDSDSRQRRAASVSHRRSNRSMPGAEPSIEAPIMSALSLPPMVC